MLVLIYPDFIKKWKSALSQFLHPFVFNENGELVQYDRFPRFNYEQYLSGINNKDIGYVGADELRAVNPDTSFKDYYHLNVWAKEGKPFTVYKRPLMNPGKDMDFKWPYPRRCNHDLERFLSARNILLYAKDAASRKVLLAQVDHVRKYPNTYAADSCGIVGGGGGPRYVSIALLKPNSVVNWNKMESGCIHALLKQIESINESFVNRCFGVRNETRDRARRLFYGGQVLFSTTKCATNVQCRDGKTRHIIKCEVYSSLKSDKYEVYLFFDSDTGGYVDHPYSKCTCRAGNYFCGHMLALFLFLRLVQLSPDIPFSTIKSVLPSEITDLDSLAIPVHLYFSGEIEYIEDDIKRLAKQVSSDQSHDDEVIDDGEDDRPTEEQLIRERVDKDYELQELLNGDSDKKARPIIVPLEAWFKSQMEKSDTKDSKKRKFTCPVVVHKQTVEQFTRTILENRRPNGSFESKLAQLECHLRFLQAYRDNLLPKGNYFNYLSYHEKIIRAGVKFLQEKNFEEFNKLQIPANLSNIPCGKCVLADRGFYYDTMRYPNFNPHLTPQMRNANGQAFTRMQRMSDIVLCSLRYTIEQTNSFLTNTAYLQDTVPFQNLRHIEKCFDYVHGLKKFNEGVFVTAFEEIKKNA